MDSSIDDLLAQLVELRGQLSKIDDGIQRLKDNFRDTNGYEYDEDPSTAEQESGDQPRQQPED